MTQEILIQELIKMNRLTGSDKEIRDKLRGIYGSKRLMFMEHVLFFRVPLFVYVFESGLVCLIFQDKQYLFENPFGKHLHGTFQLFVEEDIVVLFSGLMFVSFVFEKGGFSKIEFKQHNAWPYKCFVERNVILLGIRRRILSFTLENERFTISKPAMFMEQVLFFRVPLFVYVFESGRVCLIYNDQQYLFENPFGKHLHGSFQLFVQDNIVILFSGHMFVSFVFEKGGFSKIEFKQYNAWPYKCFFEQNVILLSIGRRILSFTLENERFTMRNYSIIHGIDGGILTLVGRTPYFVCCIHRRNSALIVVSINLITGQQNTVLKMGEHEHFDSFETRDGSLFITTFDTETVVDPRKINEPQESFPPSDFISNKPLDVACGSEMVALIISGHPVKVLVEQNRYTVHIFFKGIEYIFESPFGTQYSSGELQLFSYDNMIVLISESESSGRKFALFMYEDGVFTRIEFRNRKGSAFRCFVKDDLIVLCARDKALSFIRDFETIIMRYYSILHRIDGGILTVHNDIPYLVFCVNPVDSETNLKVVSINLITKEQKKVLEMNPENRYMAFAQLDGLLYLDTTSIRFLYRHLNQRRMLVDPSKTYREEPKGIFSDC